MKWRVNFTSKVLKLESESTFMLRVLLRKKFRSQFSHFVYFHPGVENDSFEKFYMKANIDYNFGPVLRRISFGTVLKT